MILCFRIDLSEWSIIKTPTNKPRATTCTDFGSFLNVSFQSEVGTESPLSPMDIAMHDSIMAQSFHHSSPIVMNASKTPFASKIQPPEFSPVLQAGNPKPAYEAQYVEVSTNEVKRFRSGGHSIDGRVRLNSTGTMDSLSSTGNSSMCDISQAEISEPSSPEFGRRDATHMANYMNLVEDMNSSAPLEAVSKKNDIMAAVHLPIKTDFISSISSERKRKRWISSNARTGISANMIDLALSSQSQSTGSVGQGDKTPVGTSNAGKIVGTPDYLAPEILLKKPYGMLKLKKLHII